MISTRSKFLIGCGSLAPVSLFTIWFFEIRASYHVRNSQLPLDQAAQYELSVFPHWVPKLLILVVFGLLCIIPLLISLWFDNRRKPQLPNIN
jgi:hypothetical protein